MEFTSSNQPNKLNPHWLIISTSITIISLGIYNFVFLLKFMKIIPFSNTSPKYLIFTILGNFVFKYSLDYKPNNYNYLFLFLWK